MPNSTPLPPTGTFHDQPQPAPPILTYDRPHKTAGNPNRKPILAYSCGLLIPLLLYASICLALNFQPLTQLHPREEPCKLLLVIVILWLIDCLAAFALLGSITLTRGGKPIHQIRYSPFRKALYWGILANIFPLTLVAIPLRLSDHALVGIGFATLGWHFIVPCLAFIFLCQRTHLRE